MNGQLQQWQQTAGALQPQPAAPLALLPGPWVPLSLSLVSDKSGTVSLTAHTPVALALLSALGSVSASAGFNGVIPFFLPLALVRAAIADLAECSEASASCPHSSSSSSSPTAQHAQALLSLRF